MPLNWSIARLRRPRGLTARAVLFTTGLLLVTATLTAATVLFGAQRESGRREVAITTELTAHLARVSGDFVVAGRIAELAAFIEIAASRDAVRRLSIREASGRRLAETGGNAEDRAIVDRLAARVFETGRPGHLRSADGGLASAAPIMRDGRRVGVAVMMWDANAYRFEVLPALAPFVLILACLTIVAIWLTGRVVRSAVAPLDTLVRHVDGVAEHGQVARIDLHTGDEFETLANAFNKMTSRLDASMRRIQEIAFVDPVTQLPNQDHFHREANLAVLQARDDGAIAMIAVFELRRLSKLLQTLEPDAARDFLCLVAERFANAIRQVDRLVCNRGQKESGALAARPGADQFAALVPRLASAAEAARFAQHVSAALNRPLEWRGHKVALGVCCGVALAPRDGRNAEVLIRRARMALGAAEVAPAQFKMFTQSLDREATARLTLEREIRGALDRNEFRAYYQPKVSLANGRVEACEALARWVRPDRTIIGPGRFIPIAEESGLIGPLSDAVMREACWKAASWVRAGHSAKVAVNVSALQFRGERFAEGVLRMLQHAGLPPGHLELEITESVAMEDPERAARVIGPLREAGVRLAIDDFGCGHSSLAALSKLPFDVIKIDQQFVRALERGDPQAAAIIEMILALARTLDMEVVAEGVERRVEAEFMAARGCHWAQGFFYGAAVAAPEFAEILRRQSEEEAAVGNVA